MAAKIPPATKKMTSKKKRKIQKTSPQKATRMLHYSLQNTGSMSRFAEFLAYKAKKVGKRVIRVTEDYTSQVCCNCGHKEASPLSDRLIACGNCGTQLDRDLNAAINIMVRFLVLKDHFGDLLPEPSVTEESFLQRRKGFLRYARSFRPADFGPTPTLPRRSANQKTKVAFSPLGRSWDPSQGAKPQRTDAPEAPSFRAR